VLKLRKLRQFSLLAVIVLGLIFAVRGVALWTEVDTGVHIQNWITPSSAIPGKAYMWTWGVSGNPKSEPDLWHFHVVFVANDSADVLLLWNLNESVLFVRNSARIDETFDVPLPRTSKLWRWDWLIRNPHETTLGVENFTVTHYPLSFPERQNGAMAIAVGISIIAASTAAFVYFKRPGMRPKRRS